ncbi:spinster family MFS transporter [Zavarzinia sp. CC-PAN008]|uniref:spinster family MFS transporter n=1 Tax=Zavarzinia sp. CC-PAN008 TaxID=3243332 RepID=UPI003F74AAD3
MADTTMNPALPGALADDPALRKRKYILFILTLVFASNFLDRQILSTLLQPIKNEFGVSDFALGLLSGPAFAFFYATLGIPIALYADRANRRNIIAAAVTVWSGMTVLCGMAGSFIQLALARVGVGIGEAGCTPPAHSMISDLYGPTERSGAMAVYALGITIGIVLGFVAGGWVAQVYGWRVAFFVCGAPGLILGVVVWLTVPEPTRGAADGHAAGSRPAPPPLNLAVFLREMGASFRYVLATPGTRNVIIGTAITSFVGYGGTTWGAAFLMRTHGLSLFEVGIVLGLMVGIGAGIGTYLGGRLQDKAAARDPSWNGRLVAIAKVIAVPFVLAFFFVDNLYVALLVYLPGLIVGTFYLGPSYAMMQTLVPLGMRAASAAIFLFIVNLIGMGLGPLSVGLASDLLRPTFGEDSLRYALMTMALFNLWAAWHYFKVGGTFSADAARAKAMS